MMNTSVRNFCSELWSLDTVVKNHLSVDLAELQKFGTKKNQRNLRKDIMWHAVATNT